MLQETFILFDPQTKEMAFRISDFHDGGAFERIVRYSYFSMLLVKKGEGKVVRDMSEYSFGAGALLCFSLYQPFAVYPVAELEGVVINFHPAFFCLFKHRNEVSCNGVLFNNLYETPVVILNNKELQSLDTIAQQLFAEMGREQPDEDVVLSYLKVFLIEASRVRMEQRQKDAVDNEQPDLMYQLQEAIDTNFKTLRWAGDYAQLLHISENALNKTCKAYFHKTITALIAERVTIEAKRELYLTAKPVKQIAFKLGYSDEFYFSRFFKKHAGVSPQVFRDTVGFNRLNG